MSGHSCLYEGTMRHRRFRPVPHAFGYRLFMVYLDLDELDEVFAGRWLWSTTRCALARFRREDHLGVPTVPLPDAVRALVKERLGFRPTGPVRLLTHLRYFGFVMNPVSFYYCFAADGKQLEAIVAEVNNTPWGERHCYVMDARQRGFLPCSFRQGLPCVALHGHGSRVRLAAGPAGRAIGRVHAQLAIRPRSSSTPRWCCGGGPSRRGAWRRSCFAFRS